MDTVEYIGFIASTLATLAFLPQVIKTLRTQSAEDFSVITLLMLEAGTSLWIFYGSWRSAPAIWIGNGVTFALIGLILLVKVKNISSGARPTGEAGRILALKSRGCREDVVRGP